MKIITLILMAILLLMPLTLAPQINTKLGIQGTIKTFKVANQSGIDSYYDVNLSKIKDSSDMKITYCINEDRLLEARKQKEYENYKVPSAINIEEVFSNSKTADEAPVTTSNTGGKNNSCIEIIKNPYLVDMIKLGDNSTYIISVTQSTSGITSEAPFSHLFMNNTGNPPYTNAYRYWNFDYNDSNTVYDYYGTGSDLTFSGVNFSSGHTGNGADFDGVNDYIQADSTSSLTTNTKTISFWAKPARAIATNQTIFSLDDNNYHLGFTNNSNMNDLYFAYKNFSGSLIFLKSDDGYVILNQWHHYAIVHWVNGTGAAGDKSNVTFYVDGSIVYSFQNTQGASSSYGTDNYIGSYDGEANFYNGSLDDFVFFSTNLTSAQVNNIYTSSANYFVPRGYILYEPIPVDISTSSVNVSTNIQNFSSSKINLSISYHNATGWFSSATQTISNMNNHTFNIVNATAIKLNYTLIAGGTVGWLYSPILIGNPVISGVEQTSNIYDCGYLVNANMIYTLQSNVTATGTCFTITADNITIDGNGYKINYGTDGTPNRYGIYVSGYNNFTLKNANIIEENATGSSKYAVYLISSNYSNIQNNNITTNGSSGYGIFLITSMNSTINSNTISTNGSGSTGIYLPSSLNNIVTSNTITVNGTSASGIYINRGGNYISNNNIRVKSGTTAYGIWGDVNMNNTIINSNIINSVMNGIEIQTGTKNTNWTITNNNITTTASSAEGIQFAGLFNSTISNNNITTGTAFGISFTGTTGANNIISNNINTQDAGISIAATSNLNNVSLNIISTNGTGAEGILFATGVQNSTIANNNITTTKTTSIGISLSTATSNNNTITSNNILTNTSAGISIIGSNNLISSNILNTTNAYVITLTTASSWNNTFINNSIIGRNSSIGDIRFVTAGINGTTFIDQYLEGYNFTGRGGKIRVINTQYGAINFTDSVNGTGGNFSDDIRIGNNSVYVNSSASNGGLNKSANVKLYNLPTFTLPVIYWNGNQICNSTSNPKCFNFTSLNNINVSFNVSSWSNYLIGEMPNATISLIFTPTSPINYGTQFNASCSSNGDGTLKLYRDNADVTATENNVYVTLGVGTYDYICNITSGINYNSNSTTESFTINQGNPSLSLILTSSAGWTIPASTYTTIQGTGCPPQLTCNLYQSGIAVANPFTNIFPAGNYLFTYNTTGNANYSVGSISNILTSTINGTNINGTIPPENLPTPIQQCRYKKLGYYNLNLPWIKQEGCL